MVFFKFLILKIIAQKFLIRQKKILFILCLNATCGVAKDASPFLNLHFSYFYLFCLK